MTREPAGGPPAYMDALLEAQKLAFAPVAFQVARVLRTSGVLEAIAASRGKGLDLAEIAERVGVSRYGLRVLLEAGLQMGLLRLKDGDHLTGKYRLTKVGHIIQHDEMTRINFDFVHDVCYAAMLHLDEAIAEGRPAGLAELGDWPTVYEGLSQLPGGVQKSWFAFDHFYSDTAFPDALPLVLADGPRTLLDVGGNTGRFAVACVNHSPEVAVTILDLPGQLDKARASVEAEGLADRVSLQPIDLLDRDAPFPTGFEALWMSQFLCCFSEEQIVGILERAAASMAKDSALFILDTYWDRQRTAVAAYCLVQTSLYFTCVANGNSRMYHSEDMLGCIREAGLEVVDQHDHLGISHTLIRCRRA